MKVITAITAEETRAGFASREQMRRELELLVSEVSRYQIHGLMYPKLEPRGGIGAAERRSDAPVTGAGC